MAPRRARGASKALGKRPAQPSQDGEAEARRKARFDTGLFTSVDEYQRYKQHFVQRKVVAGRNINFAHLQHFGFESLFARMGWLPLVTISEPIFPTLVRAFYSRVTFGHGGPITSTVRGFRSIWTRRASAAFWTFLLVDSEFMMPRPGRRCRVSI